MKYLLKFLYNMQKYDTNKVSIGGKSFDAIIADTYIKRMIGLMFRAKLGKGKCMVFVFPNEGIQGIWMRNMQFAIDVVWANAAGKIVDVKENLQPCDFLFNCKTYIPKESAKYVVEFNSGTVRRNGIKKGAGIKLSSA